MFTKCDVERLVTEQRLISTIVLDEADVILNDPFQRDVLECIRILTKLNKGIQVVAAGATIPRNGDSRHRVSWIGKCTPGGVLERKYPKLVWCESESKNTVPSSVQVDFVETADEAAKMAAFKEEMPRWRDE